MSDVAADALVVKGEILVEYAKPYGLNRNPNVNLASLGIICAINNSVDVIARASDICDVHAHARRGLIRIR